MSLSQPTPPDPTTTANAQQGYNTQAATTQQQLNMVNQSNPYGTTTYTRVGTYADGTPKYAATQSLTSAQQGLLNTQQQNQAGFGAESGALTNQLGGQLAGGFNPSTDALTKQLLGWQTDYMQPYFAQQQSNLNSQLAAQGISQGSDAYNNSQRALNQSQSGTIENAMAQDQGQAYNQALQNYATPIETELASLGTMYGSSLPGSVGQNNTATPQTSVQPADYSSIAENNYQQQNQNYENTLNGLFGIPSALLGGWARGGGLSSVGSMFSDRRLKTDIAQIGVLYDGTPVYRFRYRDSRGPMMIGLMSDDVRRRAPDAVGQQDGYDFVNYELATDAAAEKGRDG